jgi:mono/diheme cytochrome c family protein
MRDSRSVLAAVIAFALAARTAFPPGRAAGAGDAHFADADDLALVVLGKGLYRSQCAGCHGRYLQGQPLWQLNDTYASRRAPAFDETGFIWQRSDEAIFRATKYGRPGAPSPAPMPAFKHRLDDQQILAIVAFIKARWPLGLRIVQAMHNPALPACRSVRAAGIGNYRRTATRCFAATRRRRDRQDSR